MKKVNIQKAREAINRMKDKMIAKKKKYKEKPIIIDKDYVEGMKILNDNQDQLELK